MPATDALSAPALDQLFREARTHNGGWPKLCRRASSNTFTT